MNFYTYAYLREDKTPYYIGKGKGYRAYYKYKNEIRLPKDKSKILILKKNLTEEEAFDHEIYMIAVFGRKDLGTGILRNRTDGGDGVSGLIHSQETKDKIRKSNKGKKNGMSGSCRFKESNPMWGKKHTENTKKIQSEKRKKWFETNKSYLKGKPCPERTKQILSEKNSKEYILISPNNEVLKIKNLTKFARENNLSINCLVQVVSGRNKSHKGWKKYE